ncbi:MAG: endolytic transglycosylase MltG, partial [Thermoleophilaceae bacterium]
LDSEPEPEPVLPELDSEPEPEPLLPELDSEPEPEPLPPELEPEPEPEPLPPDPDPDSDSEPESDPDPASEPEPPRGPEPDLEPSPEAEREPHAVATTVRPPQQPPPFPATPSGLKGDKGGRRSRRSRRRSADPVAEARSAAATELLERRRAAGAGEPVKRRPLRWVAMVVLAVIALAVAWLAFSLFEPFKGEGHAAVGVRIPEGASVSDIADLLEKRGVVSSAFFFQTRATVAGRRDDFKAGAFTLKRDMSLIAAMDAISEGPPPDVVRVAVPEGRSRREVSSIVGDDLRGDYLALTRKSSQLDPRSYGAKGATSLEGFLFPATYELKKGKPTSALVSEQLRSFKRNFRGVDLGDAKRRHLSPYDVLTIASMIDREAAVAKERPVIASVIYNRLRNGIPLGIDATIRFATSNWTKPLTQSQLAVNSPYNTRTRRGLPPGPIGSPGLSSIRAAAKPARTKFLFYVVKPGTRGEHAFSRTDARFQRDVARYNRERAKRGGRSPTKP